VLWSEETQYGTLSRPRAVSSAANGHTRNAARDGGSARFFLLNVEVVHEQVVTHVAMGMEQVQVIDLNVAPKLRFKTIPAAQVPSFIISLMSEDGVVSSVTPAAVDSEKQALSSDSLDSPITSVETKADSGRLSHARKDSKVTVELPSGQIEREGSNDTAGLSLRPTSRSEKRRTFHTGDEPYVLPIDLDESTRYDNQCSNVTRLT
jgi:hypothetical protein